MALTSGARLGPYEIIAPLGAGGTGDVFKAHDTRLDRTVAIKVLPDDAAEDAEARARFAREARAISSLDHPHICALYDVGEYQGANYLVMQYLEGQALAQRLEKGPLPIEQALQWGIQIADALDWAHPSRYLKPGNVVLTRASASRQGAVQAKLLDFGLAKLRTQAGPVIGNFAFSKPSNGAEPERQLDRGFDLQFTTDWSRDGKFLVGHTNSFTRSYDVITLALSGTAVLEVGMGVKPIPFADSEFAERDGAFSPDGRWLAYASDASGRMGGPGAVPPLQWSSARLSCRWIRAALAK
jgi:serine/threonine protein kinase